MHSGEIANYRVPMGVFERTWARSQHWGMVALQPGQLQVRENPSRYFQAAAALEETHPDVDMQAIWETAVNTWPENPDMAMGQANTSYHEGHWIRAEQQYRDIIARFPNYVPAYNNLASLLIERGRPTEAVSIAEQGLHNSGGDSAHLQDTLTEAQAAANTHH